MRDITTLVACASSVVAAVATYIATARGPGLSPDSVEYLSSGLNLAAGHGLRDFGGVNLTLYPPGLPAIIAAGHWLGFSAVSFMRAVNSTAFAGAVWLGFLLLNRHVRSPLVVIGATILLGTSLALLSVAQMVWSEPVFIVIALGFILLLEQMLRSPPTSYCLVLAAGLASLAFLVRYVGMALIAAGVLSLLLGRARSGWRPALRSAAGFFFMSAAVPAIWIARNHAVDGTYMGPRPPSSEGFLFVVRNMGATLDNWLLPPPIPVALRLGGETLLVLALGALVVGLTDQARRDLLFSPGSRNLLLPLLIFVGAYATWIVVSEVTTEIDAPGARLLSPLYVPLVVLGAVAVDRLVLLVPHAAKRYVLPASTCLLVLFFLGQGVAFARDARTSAQQGVGYEMRSWQASGLIGAARNVPSDDSLYSNDPWALWAVLRREPLLQSPSQTAVSVQGLPTLPQFLKAVECHVSYLAWFANDPFVLGGRFTPRQLERYVGLDIVAVEAQGTLYRLRPDGAGCPTSGHVLR